MDSALKDKVVPPEKDQVVPQEEDQVVPPEKDQVVPQEEGYARILREMKEDKEKLLVKVRHTLKLLRKRLDEENKKKDGDGKAARKG